MEHETFIIITVHEGVFANCYLIGYEYEPAEGREKVLLDEFRQVKLNY